MSICWSLKTFVTLQEFEQQQQKDADFSTFIKEEKFPIDLSKPAKSKSLPTVSFRATCLTGSISEIEFLVHCRLSSIWIKMLAQPLKRKNSPSKSADPKR
jgi:hypothetical protein